MVNNIMAVIDFIIILIIVCKVWNLYVMRQYEKTKKEKESRLNYGYYVNNIKNLKLEGTGIDRNSDNDVAEAIKKIELLDSVGIKLDE